MYGCFLVETITGLVKNHGIVERELQHTLGAVNTLRSRTCSLLRTEYAFDITLILQLSMPYNRHINGAYNRGPP
jgi:hypothetical protein